MRHVVFLVVGLCLIVCSSSCEQKEEVPKAADLTPLAKGFVELLVKGDYATAVTRFDVRMKAAMREEKLKQAWTSLIEQVGSFKKQVGVKQTKEQEYDVVLVTCEFEKTQLDVKVVFNDYKQISGLWFVPTQ